MFSPTSISSIMAFDDAERVANWGIGAKTRVLFLVFESSFLKESNQVEEG